MDTNFDLNINNYTIKELEELFELPNNYDDSIIEIKEIKLRENIINDRSILLSTKNKTLDFINNVKKKLKANQQLISTPVSKLVKNWENIYNTNNVFKKKSSFEFTPKKMIASEYNV